MSDTTNYPFRWSELPFVLGRAMNVLTCFILVGAGISEGSFFLAITSFMGLISTLYYTYKLESLRVDSHFVKIKLEDTKKQLIGASNIEAALACVDSALEDLNGH